MSADDVSNGVAGGDQSFIDVKQWKDETGKTVFQHLSEGFAGDDEAVILDDIKIYKCIPQETRDKQAAIDYMDQSSKQLELPLSTEWTNYMVIVADGAVLRYRAPFLRVIKHDAYFDAFNLVVESMLNRLAPMWLAYTFADAFVVDHAEQLTAYRQDYVEGEYHQSDGGTWCRQIIASMQAFAKKIMSGERTLPVRPEAWSQYPISCESERGRRPKQEDRMLAMPTLSLSDVGLMAVFDGHGGAECSAYSCAHLPAEFVRALNANPTSLEESLKQAFERLGMYFRNFCCRRWTKGQSCVNKCLA
ncbi:unnamed protein product [Heligmosomoides polygyrus]|uniref:PPM-type phosphatase domain-containing protein n=1 Tax=Heligmosomoides polygyrus TaxID=6339 RepID=A0A183G9U7_HELPZ|nr:unnamed protein product [Heligmosomoides polygyrus]